VKKILSNKLLKRLIIFGLIWGLISCFFIGLFEFYSYQNIFVSYLSYTVFLPAKIVTLLLPIRNTLLEVYQQFSFQNLINIETAGSGFGMIVVLGLVWIIRYILICVFFVGIILGEILLALLISVLFSTALYPFLLNRGFKHVIN